ncbi:uncharacterized protein PHALS_00037 [Plasmopara halstedii]|uniref:Uncharacterized protein n=1 Tax=Plasmopara halstedii TaxID=4781 RepID=A0A0P1A6B3_PLAHL|nr:uncharacterized protein PHALS_00037 [Plasmopara halstedii]CEG35698.1 hypothetical protein PHALS_00037 [Plasmopara halstedii]|eukprot:XP_024572067.1 hypothetical protein PHALS_00037 [Plasmopara halstedii]
MNQVEADAPSPLYLAEDLLYTTESSCHSITNLPSSNAALTAQLLPATAAFQGNLQLSKAASGNGCTLYLAIKGVVLDNSSGLHDVFTTAQSVLKQLEKLLTTLELKNVLFARATIGLDDNKLYAALVSTESLNEASQSILKLQQGACTEMLSTLKSDVVTDFLPKQVNFSALNVVRQGSNDEAMSCAVSLDIAAVVPYPSLDVEVFQLLKAVDEKLESLFASQPSTTLADANVRLLMGPMGQKLVTTNLTLNPPSYEEAMGIFALIAVLVVMLMGVVAQKKRNDKRSRDRYERASRAAQFQRVSIRMSQHDQESQQFESEEESLL